MWQSIGEGLIRLLLIIDSVIYGFVANLFELFIELANKSSDIFSQSVISSFANRIYILVGVVAIFMITYSLLNSIINPDSLTKGNGSSSKIVINLVTSIILVALVPSIFNFAYKVQDVVLQDNIIGKVFLGTENSNNELINTESGEKIDDIYIVKQYGAQLSWSVLNAFFYTNNENLKTDWSPWGPYAAVSDGISFVACGGAVLLVAGNAVATYFSGGAAGAAIPTTVGAAIVACGGAAVNDIVSNIGEEITTEEFSWKGLVASAKMGNFVYIAEFADEVENDNVVYLPIISTIVGLSLLYMIFSYCLDLGLRAVKLAFYQMIAPLPIMARILPNNKMFNNWVKVSTTTFMEVFIRLIILFTVVFFASNISELEFLAENGGNLVKMIIIMGLVTFARQAPKLISEITGIDSGNMKLGIGEKLGAGGLLAAGAFLGGAASTGVRNFYNSWRTGQGKGFNRFATAFGSGLAGAASGGFRSAKGAGFKAKGWGDMKSATTAGINAAHNKSKDRAAYKASHGGTLGGVVAGHAQDAWSGVKNWAGITPDILEKVNYQEEYLAVFDDYKGLYNNGAYQAMDAQLNQYDARIAAEGANTETYSGSGVTLQQARDSLETQMRYKRYEAIDKNTDGAAYAMYNLAMQVKKNPTMAANAKVDSKFIQNADDFVLRNGKVTHKDGSDWTAQDLQKLIEGKTANYTVNASGKTVITGETDDATTKMYGMSFGLNSSKKDVAKDKRDTKSSIAYKEAKKAADSAKK